MPKFKTHCPQGHEFSEENTYTDSRGYRHCKTCRRERMQARRAKTPGPGRGGHNAAKTHCPQGHEYTEENTYWQPSKTSDSGYARTCRACAQTNGKKQNVNRYGITPEDLEELTQKQDNRCAICQREFTDDRKRNIDHDHSCCPKNSSCGECIRGLLCTGCNKGLGQFEDNPEYLRAALLYLGQEL